MQEIINTEKITIKEDNKSAFLNGIFKPNAHEYTADSDSLEVIGEIPADIYGVYVRNTHNQVHEPIGAYHPFDGDGMLHAAYFKNGRMEYRNRFVHTVGFLAEKAAGRALWPGLLEPDKAAYRGWGAIGAMKDNAGTDIICHAGKLLVTMSQGSEPWRMDPITLENLGPDPELARIVRNDGIAGEFKVDCSNGEMAFINYPESPPYLNYGLVDKQGHLIHYEPIDLPGARWPHDFGLTEHYAIFHDLPVFFNQEELAEGRRQIKFHKELPARFGVRPRYGKDADVTWFEGTPCYILHTANYFEEGDEVVMDGCISTEPAHPSVGQVDDLHSRIMAHLDKHQTKTRMHRWRFNMKTGETKEEYLDDEVSEFPVCRNNVLGHPYRYAYCSLFEKGQWLMNGIKKFDLQTGETTRYEYGEGRYGGEVHFAARQNDQSEDDGYLVVFIQDLVKDRSECALFDAQDIAKGPITQIILPERIQTGTHACWVEGERLAGEPV